LLIILAFLVPFSIANKKVVLVKLFPFSYEISIPLYLLITGIFFIAFVFGYMFSKVTNFKLKKNGK
tara:strand:- start:2431 stop:2628 length:198 start_codon:yes stop_codon:yes gene_type:complete